MYKRQALPVLEKKAAYAYVYGEVRPVTGVTGSFREVTESFLLIMRALLTGRNHQVNGLWVLSVLCFVLSVFGFRKLLI